MDFVYGVIIGIVIIVARYWRQIIDLWTFKKQRRVKLEMFEQQQLIALKSKQLEDVKRTTDRY